MAHLNDHNDDNIDSNGNGNGIPHQVPTMPTSKNEASDSEKRGDYYRAPAKKPEDNGLSHVNSCHSISSLESASNSSRHHKEIYENVVIVENEALSRHSHSASMRHNSPQSHDAEAWDEQDNVIAASLPFAVIHPHNNHDTTPQPTTPHPPDCVHDSHISELSKLHISNLNNNNSTLTPSPNDATLHQDIKYRKLRSSKTIQQHATSSSLSLRHALWSSLQTVHSYANNAGSANDLLGEDGGDGDNEVKHEDDGDDDEKKQTTHSVAHHSQHSRLQSLVNSPRFMSNAIAMYGELDHALQNINTARQQRLQQQRHGHGGQAGHDNNNEQVIDAMKTLLASTTEMSSFFNTDTDTTTRTPTKARIEPVPSPSTSMIGGLLQRLSSSIAYMSYVSISSITPFVYNMVEAVLVELYETIKDIIEFYDPDPKNNILWRLIHKMSEIIEAIRGLIALGDCFYENAEDEDADHQSSFSLFQPSKKEKKD